VAIAPGLKLWEAPVSLDVEAGVTVSETVQRLLDASGTGIQLLETGYPFFTALCFAGNSGFL
jgi:hypothetical protein